MRLGADDIVVELAGEAFVLRPTLRACTRLMRRHGLGGMVAAASDFNTSIVMDVLRECGIRPDLLPAEIEAHGLALVRTRLADPLAEFVMAIAGVDPEAKPAPAPTGKQLTHEELHTRLFEIATGWLGWTPEEAWNATIPEIIAARAGRMGLIEDVLHTLFGAPAEKPRSTNVYSPDRLAEIEASGFDPAFDRGGLHALKGSA
jgi:hypothetical protein